MESAISPTCTFQKPQPKQAPVSATVNFANGYPTPGPQSPSAQEVVDHVFFLSEHDWKEVREEEQFDFIIIGSGVCGYAFAQRIAVLDENLEKKRRILILERGPFFLPDHFQNLPLTYQLTIGGTSTTFPWTLSRATIDSREKRYIGYQSGMVPFFGGRSLQWSGWCPRPLPEEMVDWPKEVIEAAESHFESAEELLQVVPADEIDPVDDDPAVIHFKALCRPVYGQMQRGLQKLLIANLDTIPSATRCIPAPLAAAAGREEGIDFAKWAVPPELLRLAKKQADSIAKTGTKSPLRMKTECTVEQIIQHEGRAIALSTSKGMVNVGDAKVILAMGTLPPTTLLANSFPGLLPTAGERFTAHFITAIVARVPRADYVFTVDGESFDFNKLNELELAAIYMAGKADNEMQYHVQLTVLSDMDPKKNQEKAARYMPDVVATATPEQLATSEKHLVFVCAVLGELHPDNRLNYFRRNQTSDLTTNSTLQCIPSQKDLDTWDTMDVATFEMLKALAPNSADDIEYWHGTDENPWKKEHPTEKMRRVPGLVHEGSTLWIGGKGPVGLDYRPRGVDNVYVTGAGLWPTGGSWNPTMTMVALTQDLAEKLHCSK